MFISERRRDGFISEVTRRRSPQAKRKGFISEHGEEHSPRRIATEQSEESTKSLSTSRGFTLIELLLSVGIIAILGGLSLPVFRGFLIKNDLDAAEDAFVQDLRRAQILSQAVDGDSPWGVYVQSGSITLFQGATYAARTTDFDEIYEMASNITPSGVQEWVYSKLYGLPQSTGSLVLTSVDGESRTTTVNTKGRISR